jgi:hypothetical protein
MVYKKKNTLENTEGAIKNGQSRDSDNIAHTYVYVPHLNLCLVLGNTRNQCAT